MKALTITPSAQRSSQTTARFVAKSKNQFREVTKKVSSVVFSERVALGVTCVGSAAAFFFAVAEQPRTCVAFVAVSLPWFMSLLTKEGGAK